MCGIIALLMLVCCWFVSDFELRTKMIITGIFILTWGLAFVDIWALLIAHALFTLIVGAFTFAGGFGRR